MLSAGVTGLLFDVWPTNIGDRPVQIDTIRIAKISELRAQRKFESDAAKKYPGAPNDLARLEAQSLVDSALDDIISLGEGDYRKSLILAIIKRHLRGMKYLDTEEREQACEYFAVALKILGIENSSGLFPVFLHGFPLDFFIHRNP